MKVRLLLSLLTPAAATEHLIISDVSEKCKKSIKTSKIHSLSKMTECKMKCTRWHHCVKSTGTKSISGLQNECLMLRKVKVKITIQAYVIRMKIQSADQPIIRETSKTLAQG